MSDSEKTSSAESDEHIDAVDLPTHYVAIGASAGGLEALQEFFQHMPSQSGLAFIVIQHLSPDFKSVMDELLARCTDMKIFHATDSVKVDVDTVYLIPPRKNMMIAEGKLLLADQMPDSGFNFPIDIFFRSLAEDQHHRSVGIVLSGTGSDGSRGLQAIKEVGGTVMVQEPKSAKFNGMPYNAVKTGFADVVAPSAELPGKLIRFISHPMISDTEQSLVRQVEDSDGAFQDIFLLLKDKSDIDFSQYKPATVARRIERRISLNSLQNLSEYHSLLLKTPSEIQILAKDMLIGVTRFFRDDEPFENLEKNIIPAILDNTEPGKPIRVWNAGCSSGEEPYSVAILFDEAMRKRGETWQIKIFATDVDPDAIAEASTGLFNINICEDMSRERVDRYFVKKDDQLSIVPTIRRMVVFATHNLITDPPFSNTQLAMCRNVLIYFQSEAQQRALSMLHFSLLKDGYLFLGASESLGELQSYFEPVNDRFRQYRKAVATRLMMQSLGKTPEQAADRKKVPSVELLLRTYQDKQKPVSNSPMIESLMEEYIPACIVLSQDYEVLHAYGDVATYTRKYQSGKFSANIKDIIVDELSIAVSTALHRAVAEKRSVKYDNVGVTRADQTVACINLRAHYVNSKALDSYQLALIFETSTTQTVENNEEVMTYNASDQSHQRIQDLETQLKKNQEHLQITIEELETTNEELQASNEELLAANEELQSTNEELQSVNEELYTVNSEYQEKIEEISNVNTDLDNIMKSIDIGILFLDDAMLIRNYTPDVTRVINLLKTDLGRPFHHISHNLKSSSLLQDIANVIETGESFVNEVETFSGQIVLVKITAYINEVDEQQGCVLSVTDVTESRTLHGKLEESYEHLRSMLSSSFKDIKPDMRVLVVDDRPSEISHVKKLLTDIDSKYNKDKRYEISECSTYDDAIKVLDKEQFDICFIDYQLDTGTAFDLVESFETKSHLPPFVMLSGLIGEKLYESAIALGIYDAINKDELNPRVLERSIRSVMRLKQVGDYLDQRYIS